MKKKKKGFTLIELLAVIVILAILAGITAIMVTNYVENSKINTDRMNALNISNAVLRKWQLEGNENNRGVYVFTDSDEEKINSDDLLEKSLDNSPWTDNGYETARAIIDEDGNVSICLYDKTAKKGVVGTYQDIAEDTDLDAKDTEVSDENSITLRYRNITRCPDKFLDFEEEKEYNPAYLFAKDTGARGLNKITHYVNDTLQVDERFKIEYRYVGGNVRNYVTFNNEMWRIIGIIPTEDTDGNVEYRFKLIKNQKVASKAWNDCTSSNKSTCDDTGKYLNNWTTSSINTYLNGEYYNTLSTEAQNMIGTTKYYLGGYKDSKIFKGAMWQYERKKANDSTGKYFYGNNPTFQSDASKKIGLMYVSDFAYASTCDAYLDFYNLPQCTGDNNWIWYGAYANIHNITPRSDFPNVAFHIRTNYVYAQSDGFAVSYSFDIVPVVSLKPSVKVTSGTGTSDDPYILSM